MRNPYQLLATTVPDPDLDSVEICRVCGGLVLMMCQIHTGYCSQICERSETESRPT